MRFERRHAPGAGVFVRQTIHVDKVITNSEAREIVLSLAKICDVSLSTIEALEKDFGQARTKQPERRHESLGHGFVGHRKDDGWVEIKNPAGKIIFDGPGPMTNHQMSMIVVYQGEFGSFKPIPEDKSDLDGRQVMIFGPSGYVEPNHWHIETAHWDAERDGWYNDAHDRIGESWPQPTHYAELVDIEKVAKR